MRTKALLQCLEKKTGNALILLGKVKVTTQDVFCQLLVMSEFNQLQENKSGW